MSDLQNLTPANTYKGLLQVGDYTNGVDSTVKAVLDGEGTTSALAIGTTKVGIGTTSPTQELDVNGNVVADEYALDQTGTSSSAVAIHAPATNELAIRTNSTEAIRIDSSGQVGIGTTNPIYPLDVFGFGKAIGITSTHADGTRITHASLSNDSSGYGRIDAYNNVGNSVVRILSNGNSYFNGGNVGVGTASPNTLLDVDGVSTFRVPTGGSTIISYAVGDTTSVQQPGLVLRTNETEDADRVKLNSDGDSFFNGGKLGIGTIAPSAPLEVASTTGGVIMPRMTTTQMNAISSPTDGEMIYNTTENKFYGRANGAWTALH